MSGEVERAAQQGYENAKKARAAAAREHVVVIQGTGSVHADATVQQAADPGGAHQRSYQASAETPDILQELRVAFRLSTDSAVIRRALALARVIVRAAHGGNSILIRKRDGRELEIILRD